MNEKYVARTMNRFASIIFNTSQSDYFTKDRILDSMISVLDDYNKDVEKVFPECKTTYKDFRK